MPEGVKRRPPGVGAESSNVARDGVSPINPPTNAGDGRWWPVPSHQTLGHTATPCAAGLRLAIWS